MNKLFTYADQYIAESDWKVFAFVKFCLASIGILIGIHVPEDRKKAVSIAALGVFLVTYVPLMVKFYRIVFPYGEE